MWFASACSSEPDAGHAFVLSGKDADLAWKRLGVGKLAVHSLSCRLWVVDARTGVDCWLRLRWAQVADLAGSVGASRDGVLRILTIARGRQR
jgi:hypothetical protein